MTTASSLVWASLAEARRTSLPVSSLSGWGVASGSGSLGVRLIPRHWSEGPGRRAGATGAGPRPPAAPLHGLGLPRLQPAPRQARHSSCPPPLGRFCQPAWGQPPRARGGFSRPGDLSRRPGGERRGATAAGPTLCHRRGLSLTTSGSLCPHLQAGPWSPARPRGGEAEARGLSTAGLPFPPCMGWPGCLPTGF